MKWSQVTLWQLRKWPWFPKHFQIMFIIPNIGTNILRFLQGSWLQVRFQSLSWDHKSDRNPYFMYQILNKSSEPSKKGTKTQTQEWLFKSFYAKRIGKVVWLIHEFNDLPDAQSKLLWKGFATLCWLQKQL